MHVSNHQRVFLSIGSNLGERVANLDRALLLLQDGGLEVRRRSSMYETEPVGVEQQPEFMNLACEISSNLEPAGLLKRCLEVERRMGRKRGRQDGPRVIDIDIVFYGHQIVELEHLTIPHPRRLGRRFVLVPLTEIAPGFVDPLTGITLEQSLEQCRDSSWVRKVEQPQEKPLGPAKRTRFNNRLE